LQLSSDGEVVVIHDETLGRTTNGQGLVGNYELAALRQFDASAGRTEIRAQIPTLNEVLELFAGTNMVLNLEFKTSIVEYLGIEEKVLEKVAAFGMTEQVVFSSFNHYTLDRVKQLGTTAEIAILLKDQLYQPWEYAQAFGANALHVCLAQVKSRGFIQQAKDAGLKVRVYGVEADADLRRMMTWGADAVITNDPRNAQEIRAQVDEIKKIPRGVWFPSAREL
ncbi:MAG: hypothetical protein FWG47_08375, partial [Propionibacteriaceae bacterium]|nr:hypothetical protein [Propionibacteriaceae bacterium]